MLRAILSSGSDTPSQDERGCNLKMAGLAFFHSARPPSRLGTHGKQPISAANRKHHTNVSCEGCNA
jgi:hypothetical protein